VPASALGCGIPRKEGYEPIRPTRLILLASLATLAVAVPAQAHHAPGCRSHRCHARAYGLWLKHHPYTGYVVAGKVSTFGYLTGDSEGTTADGGTTARPCIALWDRSTLDRWFEVTILGHRARLLHCDTGPAPWTGRAIDVTGVGDQALGFSPAAFPTDSPGVARELR
jgi:hypothetical protein